jgi:hypothetical protein
VRKVLLVLCVLALVILAAPSPASAQTRRICTKSATLRDTPRGFAIARLYRRQRVHVVRRSGERGWTPVRTTNGLPGWILTKSLCRG